MKGWWLLIIILGAWQFLPAQDDISPALNRQLFFEKKEQKIYLGLRLPQSFFTKTDLRIHGYAVDPLGERHIPIDITIENIEGKDDGFIYPAFFGAFRKGLEAPPLEVAFGYKLGNSSWGIGGRWIHYKFTMVPGQRKPVHGYFDTTLYNGSVQEFPFLQEYEHTDGHNMICIGPEYNRTVVESKNKLYALDFSGFFAPALAVPRTAATIVLPNGYEVGDNNSYKISGGGILAEASLMASLWKYIGINIYANYSCIWYRGATILEGAAGDVKARHFIGAFTYGSGLFLQVPVKTRDQRKAS